jgi:hypothetical protein
MRRPIKVRRSQEFIFDTLIKEGVVGIKGFGQAGSLLRLCKHSQVLGITVLGRNRFAMGSKRPLKKKRSTTNYVYYDII